MNICFYTAERPTADCVLNMAHLVHSRPQHNYSFLAVKSAEQLKPGLMQQLRQAYGKWRFNDGRFDFQNDLIVLHKKLTAATKPLNMGAFKQGMADTANDAKSVQFLKEVKPDVIIQAGAGILKPEIFTLASKGAINLHHGLSPEIRGIESTFWCMFYGLREKIGVSCHFIEVTLDTGAIIRQRTLQSSATAFADLEFDNYMMGLDVLTESIDVLDKGRYNIKSLGEVKSYYFGDVNPFLYYALKRRNYTPVMKISERAFKMKERKCVE